MDLGVNKDYKRLVKDVSDYFYPSNDQGYKDPEADMEEIMTAVNDFVESVRKCMYEIKLKTCKRMVNNLELWLEHGECKGKPITPGQRKWATEKIAEAKTQIAEIEGVTDNDLQEAVDGYMTSDLQTVNSQHSLNK